MSYIEKAQQLVRALPSETVQPITEWTWREKYRHHTPDGSSNEHSVIDTHHRVIRGVYANDPAADTFAPVALASMMEQVWCPAGRIHAGAGTENLVTLINCFVSPDIEDSMRTERDQNSKGIGDALNVAMFTQQMGGGIGMDFSTLRPNLSTVKRTNSMSTGPLPFMGMWDAMCETIKSSGSRRGAMMGVLRCDHPDIMSFVRAKRTKGVLENFNVSILVTDRFMEAVKNDEDWSLGFNVPKADGQHVDVIEDTNGPWFVYEVVKAREMWNEITSNTFEYAEPGIIFIDRVNKRNNLWYCEHIHATNPCGEQPLPANGDCNLGAINLARLVNDPFLEPTFDFDKLGKTARLGMRFLDNVLDVSLFPTIEQHAEAMNKRRTGLGITGLGNALQQLKLRYGSKPSLEITGQIMRTIRDEAFRESIELAKERGPFPMLDREKYLQADFIKKLPEDIREGIAEHGIRNGVLLTIAPTGTTSMYYGNISSGIEPTFAWKYTRKVRQPDGTLKVFGDVFDYGYLQYCNVLGHKEGEALPDYMVSALELPVEDHLAMQAVCQQYVDASISKTINCPDDMDFEAFKDVYMQAYDLNCKGCTTYRPSDVRGSILSVEGEKKTLSTIHVEPRPEELEGSTYKVKYPGLEQAFYITINDYTDGSGMVRPFEIFINTKSVKHQEWIVALTRMLSAIFRRGGDVTFIVEELKQVFSAQGGAWVNKQYLPSLVAFIGTIIERHFVKIGLIAAEGAFVEESEPKTLLNQPKGEMCPSCEAPTMVKQEGCNKCTSCGFSDCG